MKRYQFTIIRQNSEGQQVGKRCGVYMATGARVRSAAARALDQFEKEHGQTSKQLFLTMHVMEVR